MGQGASHRDASAATASLRPALVAAPQSWPESTPLLDPALVDASDPAAMPVTVGDILKTHGMAAAQAAEADQGALAPSVPTSHSAALAETTRRAQQGLGALVDGLATVTRSLRQSQAAGGN